eukprot:Hpha_TRINITY_DN15315_c1_g1::TRINITY_DN15315_c1_g1_i1::g.91342::m.91342
MLRSSWGHERLPPDLRRENAPDLDTEVAGLHNLQPEQIAERLKTSLQDGLTHLALARRDAERSGGLLMGRPSRRERLARRASLLREDLVAGCGLSPAARIQAEAVMFAGAVQAARPYTCVVKRDGVCERVPAGEVAAGDLLVLEPGALVPATAVVVRCSEDATIARGDAHVREVSTQPSSPSPEDSSNVTVTADVVLQGRIEAIAVGDSFPPLLASRRKVSRESSHWLASAVAGADLSFTRRVPGTHLPSTSFCEQLLRSHFLVRGRQQTSLVGRASAVLIKEEALAVGRQEVRAVVLSLRALMHDELDDSHASSPLFQRFCEVAAAVPQTRAAHSWLSPTAGEAASCPEAGEAALLRFADRWGVSSPDSSPPLAAHPETHGRPIQVTARQKGGSVVVYASGSPCSLLPYCQRYATETRGQQRKASEAELTPEAQQRIDGLVRFLQSHHGLSVVALASGEFAEPPEGLTRNDLLHPPQGLTLVGLAGLTDQARDGAAGWVQVLKMMGLGV